uniref:Uncharacterized protein n=1 Tax=Setaria italica TaxID=4555 RepID=K3Y2N7_SETIT
MDSSDNCRHGYHVPFPRGDALNIYRHPDNTYGCPVCPARIHRWRILNEVKDNILGMARTVALRGDNKKKWSRHHVVAWNEGWMLGWHCTLPI